MQLVEAKQLGQVSERLIAYSEYDLISLLDFIYDVMTNFCVFPVNRSTEWKKSLMNHPNSSSSTQHSILHERISEAVKSRLSIIHPCHVADINFTFKFHPSFFLPNAQHVIAQNRCAVSNQEYTAFTLLHQQICRFCSAHWSEVPTAKTHSRRRRTWACDKELLCVRRHREWELSSESDEDGEIMSRIWRSRSTTRKKRQSSSTYRIVKLDPFYVLSSSS